MGIENDLKCPYKTILEDPDNTTFENPNEKLKNCYNCNGYGLYKYQDVELICDFYLSYIKTKRSYGGKKNGNK